VKVDLRDGFVFGALLILGVGLTAYDWRSALVVIGAMLVWLGVYLPGRKS
jgi:hypothetical protein